MIIATLLVFSENLLQQNPLLYFLLSLTAKSSLIIVAAYLASVAWKSLPASNRSTLWLVAITSILTLPLFSVIFPELKISVPIQELQFSQATQWWEQTQAPGLRLFRIVLIVYVLGVTLSLSTLVVDVINVCRASINRRLVTQGRARQILSELQAMQGSHAQIDLYRGDKVMSPYTWGIRRHRIILPGVAFHWDDAMLRRVLSHELGHIQRNDWLFYLLSRLVRSLYWPNPLIWLAVRAFAIETEKACDDAAISMDDCSLDYAENLLSVADQLRVPVVRSGMAMFSPGTKLSRRVHHILSPQGDRHFLRIDEILIVLILLSLFSTPLAVLRLVPVSQAAEQTLPLIIPVVMETAGNDIASGLSELTSCMDCNHPASVPTPIPVVVGEITLQRDTTIDLGNFQTLETGAMISLDSLNREVITAAWEPTTANAPSPEYPSRARQQRIEGYVTAEITINDTGRVVTTRIIDSVPAGTFDRSVMQAVNGYVYVPDVQTGSRGNGPEVRTGSERTLQLTFRFSLSESLK